MAERLSLVEEKLKAKLSEEDFTFASQLLKLPVSRIREFIEEEAGKAESG